MTSKANQSRDKPRLGELKPLYKFFLNPYADVRFTSYLQYKPAPRWEYRGPPRPR